MPPVGVGSSSAEAEVDAPLATDPLLLDGAIQRDDSTGSGELDSLLDDLEHEAASLNAGAASTYRGYVQLENMAKPKAWTRLLIVAEATADKLRKPASIRFTPCANGVDCTCYCGRLDIDRLHFG